MDPKKIAAFMFTELLSSSSSSDNFSSGTSDSSSSSDSEVDMFEEMMLLFNAATSIRETPCRVEQFIERTIHSYSDQQFRQNFRLNKDTAQKLIELYANSDYYKVKADGGGRKELSAETQMLSFLWFCANKNCIREVSNLFGQTRSSFLKHTNLILDFFRDLAPTVIKFPLTAEEKERNAAGFRKIAGFDNVLGCIDGSYVYTTKPDKELPTAFVNRHDQLSITLQAICDHRLKFIDVCVGPPSSMHDARIFALSPIAKKIAVYCEDRYHILGDAAYPLRTFLLTPFKKYRTLSRKENNYNKKHCATRVKIENAFGILKKRFRQLMRLDFRTVKKASKFVLACCVLHNLCIDYDDFLTTQEQLEVIEEGVVAQDQENQPNDDDQEQNSQILQRQGATKRNNIAENMYEYGIM